MAEGFYNSPITKVIMWSGVAMTMLSGSQRVGSQVFIGDQSQITAGHQAWRLFTSLIPSEGLAEGLISWYLLYSFRLFERELGSSKFAVFVALSSALAVATRGILAASLPSSAVHGISSGPYHIIFGLLPLYYRLVPSLVPAYFTLCGIKFSDKTLTYALALQLSLNGGLRSALPAAAGILFGILYAIDATRLNQLRMPAPIRRFFRAVVLPILQSSPPGGGAGGPGGRGGAAAVRSGGGAFPAGAAGGPASPRRQYAAGGGGADGWEQAPAAGGAAAAAAAGGGGGGGVGPGPEPTAEQVAGLVALGFSEDDARRELRRSWGNVEVAAARLLDG